MFLLPTAVNARTKSSELNSQRPASRPRLNLTRFHGAIACIGEPWPILIPGGIFKKVLYTSYPPGRSAEYATGKGL